MKQPWSLRDNPASLIVTVIGVLIVMLTLGWLTLRLGTVWAKRYIHLHSRISE
jgi:uncharacterized protein (DUF983 family)